MFERGDSPSPGGTGVGLVIVRQIATALEGIHAPSIDEHGRRADLKNRRPMSLLA